MLGIEDSPIPDIENMPPMPDMNAPPKIPIKEPGMFDKETLRQIMQEAEAAAAKALPSDPNNMGVIGRELKKRGVRPNWAEITRILGKE